MPQVLQICQRKKDGDEELYVIWVDEAPDVSLPFGTPSSPGHLTVIPGTAQPASRKGLFHCRVLLAF